MSGPPVKVIQYNLGHPPATAWRSGVRHSLTTRSGGWPTHAFQDTTPVRVVGAPSIAHFAMGGKHEARRPTREPAQKRVRGAPGPGSPRTGLRPGGGDP